MAQGLTKPLLLVGCGKMGGAMLSGWLADGIAAAGVFIVDPSGAQEYRDRPGVTVVPDAGALPKELDPEVVLLAVKPQQMDAALTDYRRFASPGTLFISVAAGKTISYFEKTLGAGAAIVRAMPNTPAAIGQGITVLCPNANTNDAQLALAKILLSAVGEVEALQDEELMDAVTALSGGGPAYVFLMIECMTKAGIAAGLPEDLAARLSMVTVAGAGQLAYRSGEEPSVLRKNVTSPGGTTLEALNVLMGEGGLEPLMVRAIAAATKRSKELAG